MNERPAASERHEEPTGPASADARTRPGVGVIRRGVVGLIDRVTGTVLPGWATVQ